MAWNGSDVKSWAQRQAEEYRQGEDRPLGGYVAVMGVYAAGVTATALLGRLLRRPAPERISPYDLAQLTVATHRISRTLAKDPVASPIRAPFTNYEGVSGAAELKEGVRGHGVQHSVGELLSCPMCLAQWVATGLSAGLVLAPRQTRLVMATFTAVAGADFLQYLYAYLQQATE
jgi:uncharacterized protein DUF1360